MGYVKPLFEQIQTFQCWTWL